MFVEFIVIENRRNTSVSVIEDLLPFSSSLRFNPICEDLAHLRPFVHIVLFR